jgi:SnoaL-like domain
VIAGGPGSALPNAAARQVRPDRQSDDRIGRMDRESERAIEWDCTRLVISFYNLLDEKRYRELADLFAVDGAWVRLGRELIGPKAIVEAMGERGNWLTAHVVSNIPASG